MDILRAKAVVIRSLFRYIFLLQAKEKYWSGTSNRFQIIGYHYILRQGEGTIWGAFLLIYGVTETCRLSLLYKKLKDGYMLFS